ncbi:MAG: aldehyde dehydrogenase family protein [Chloroflexi bacterium]|nr:aldehyde dehydrogenase family protein [Chloroflexota bacterium]
MDKITYASLGSLGDEFHQRFDAALDTVRGELGRTHALYIGGKARKTKDNLIIDTSPIDTRIVLGQFQRGSRADTVKAIAAARAAYPGWRDLGWAGRVALLRKAAQNMLERQYELAALMVMEVGKNRFEAIAEVSETIDLILYYSQQMEEHRGYEVPMAGAGAEQTRSVMRPFGVWAVVAPFNFPMALATGMATGALVAGNTIVFKPASDTPYTGLKIYEVFRDAGLPDGVFNFLTGPGSQIGEELIENPGVDGFVFTGSLEVGMNILHRFTTKWPKPCIAEMGGKNPAIVMPSADLDSATEGVLRSAFGMGGQKCSALSRLYLHRDISRPFMEMLVEKTRMRTIGDPQLKETFLGPLINAGAVKTYEQAMRVAKKHGRIAYGGHTLKQGDFQHGFYVEPAIVDRLPKSSSMFRDEYFVPILAVAEVRSLDEALKLANDSDYGLTAGIFSRDEAELARFFDQIESGVTYSNRRGGATTGAWPGVQSFGGWKGSGTTGKNGLGPNYVMQFMREQSQTMIKA